MDETDRNRRQTNKFSVVTPSSSPSLTAPLTVDVRTEMLAVPSRRQPRIIEETIMSDDLGANIAYLFDVHGERLAGFEVNERRMICLPQAYDIFLKKLVGGLHTIYTKLRRLGIHPLICNVEQVRALRNLGAIQLGVNRCKLIDIPDFEKLFDDCANLSSRPGRPSKRPTSLTSPMLDGSHWYSKPLQRQHPRMNGSSMLLTPCLSASTNSQCFAFPNVTEISAKTLKMFEVFQNAAAQQRSQNEDHDPNKSIVCAEAELITTQQLCFMRNLFNAISADEHHSNDEHQEQLSMSQIQKDDNSGGKCFPKVVYQKQNTVDAKYHGISEKLTSFDMEENNRNESLSSTLIDVENSTENSNSSPDVLNEGDKIKLRISTDECSVSPIYVREAPKLPRAMDSNNSVERNTTVYFEHGEGLRETGSSASSSSEFSDTQRVIDDQIGFSCTSFTTSSDLFSTSFSTKGHSSLVRQQNLNQRFMQLMLKISQTVDSAGQLFMEQCTQLKDLTEKVHRELQREELAQKKATSKWQMGA